MIRPEPHWIVRRNVIHGCPVGMEKETAVRLIVNGFPVMEKIDDPFAEMSDCEKYAILGADSIWDMVDD